MRIKTSQIDSGMIGDGLRASVPMSETDPPGIGQLVREPRTFPHPLLTVRCSFKQRRLGVCRAESGSVSLSDIRTGHWCSETVSDHVPESVYDVFIFIRDTFTN